jgi:hypothetical protein
VTLASSPSASRVTITVATVQGWPDIEPNLRSFEAAAAAAGGDVLVADGSGRPAPAADFLGPSTTWLERPGASVFQLREACYREASAPIVGVTEDHCFLPVDWAERNLTAHEAHPEALAVGGGVINGATDTAMDWASFLVVQAAVAAPIRSGEASRISGAVSVTYKAAALDGMDDHDGLGAMDALHQRALTAAGATLIADDGIRVVHDQSLGFVGTVLIHFHAGRTMAGFRRRHLDARQIVRLVATPLIPAARFGRIAALIVPRGYAPQLTRVAPAIWLLLVTQTVGQVVGYVLGPGDSPNRVQ